MVGLRRCTLAAGLLGTGPLDLGFFCLLNLHRCGRLGFGATGLLAAPPFPAVFGLLFPRHRRCLAGLRRLLGLGRILLFPRRLVVLFPPAFRLLSGQETVGGVLALGEHRFGVLQPQARGEGLLQLPTRQQRHPAQGGHHPAGQDACTCGSKYLCCQRACCCPASALSAGAADPRSSRGSPLPPTTPAQPVPWASSSG